MVDHYPSRTLERPEFFRRREPVVWGHKRMSLGSYEDDGYFLLPNFFTGQKLASAQRDSEKLFNNPADTGIAEPDSDVTRSVFAVHDRPAFEPLLRDDRLLSFVSGIVGGSSYVHQSRVNFKSPLGSTGWTWHSDFETWHTEDGMPGMRAVTAMIALSDNTYSNGPLMVIPGSHKRFIGCVGETPDGNYAQHLKDQKVGIPDRESLTEMVRESGNRIEPIICNAGSVLLFDCNLIHGSNANITPAWRTNLFFVYNSIMNRLLPPFCGKPPRPEHVATRSTYRPIYPMMETTA